MLADARPQARKNLRRIHWNALRIFSGRERRRCRQIICHSRMTLLGQTPNPRLKWFLTLGAPPTRTGEEKCFLTAVSVLRELLEPMRPSRHYISALDCSLSQATNALRSMRLWCSWYPGMLE